MILVIGFMAGSLLPDGSGLTYTSAEYEELLKLGKEPLVFVKKKKNWWQQRAKWRNEERDPKKRKALDDFKSRVGEKYTWNEFTTSDELALAVVLALDDWEARGRPGARKDVLVDCGVLRWQEPSRALSAFGFRHNSSGPRRANPGP
jgi:hypothetical protein